MQRIHLRIVSLFSLLSITSLCAFTANQNESPGESMAKMFKLGEELATPNANHQFLKKLSGDWVTTSSIMDIDEELGFAKNEMIFGDRFIDSSYGGTFAGVEYTGRMTIGFDNYKNKFVAVFIDSLGTSMRTAEGMLDQTKTTLSLWGAMDEWMTDEHDKPVMYRYNIIDHDHFDLEIHDLGIVPGETTVITMVFKRLKK
jgi:hypothetical protein